MARREGHRPRLALLPPHSESSITCKIDAKPVFIKLIPTQIQALGGESGRPRLPFPEGVHQTQDRLHSFSYPWWQLAQLCNPRAQSSVVRARVRTTAWLLHSCWREGMERGAPQWLSAAVSGPRCSRPLCVARRPFLLGYYHENTNQVAISCLKFGLLMPGLVHFVQAFC